MLFLFFYTIFLATSLPILIPSIQIFYFIPLLLLSLNFCTLVGSLWLALFTGCFIDLLSANTHFGIHALTYCVCIYSIRAMKPYFFEDSILTLPTMTFLFTVNVNLMYSLLSSGFGPGTYNSWQSIVPTFIGVPLIQAFYALIAFSLPGLLLPKRRMRKTRVLFSKADYS